MPRRGPNSVRAGVDSDLARARIVRAESFAAVLYRILDREYWGQIEPAIFNNVGCGAYDTNLDADKLSQEEAASAAKGMRDAIAEALATYPAEYDRRRAVARRRKARI